MYAALQYLYKTSVGSECDVAILVSFATSNRISTEHYGVMTKKLNLLYLFLLLPFIKCFVCEHKTLCTLTLRTSSHKTFSVFSSLCNTLFLLGPSFLRFFAYSSLGVLCRSTYECFRYIRLNFNQHY